MAQPFVSLSCAGRLRPWLAGAAIALGTFTAQADWQLVWSDEFNGVSIDTNHWKFETGNHRGWGNHELEYYTDRPENVCVSNGVLHIVARKESTNGIFYTSARLKSQGLFAKKYGRFEFRAKFPGGQGYWPALWLMPEHSAYGRWPASGEIDVVENKGNIPNKGGGTIHYGGQYGDVYSGRTYTFPSGDSVTNFHTYLLEWTTNKITWSVDGNLYETQINWWSNVGKSADKYPYPAPFDQPFYIIMNLAVGGDYGGDPDAHTVFPGEMQVDYIRVYDNVATNSVR